MPNDFTLAGESAIPSPEEGLTEKAVATQDVIVSGACDVNAAEPSVLQHYVKVYINNKRSW